MKQVLSCTATGHSYENTHSVLSATSSSHSDAENHPPTILDVKVEDCGITTVSMSVLKNMWRKAKHIPRSKGGILKVPWSSDKETRLVMGSSSEQPHLVKKNSRNKKQYCCDEKCPMFKGFMLCSHVIAAAHDNGDAFIFGVP